MMSSPRYSLRSHRVSKPEPRRYLLRPRPASKQTVSQAAAMSRNSLAEPVSFLVLPPEIRRMVYVLVITSSAQPTTVRVKDLIPPVIPISHRGLILACIQTCNEFRQHFFNTGTYLLTIPRLLRGVVFSKRHPPPYILGPSCLNTRLQIQSLRIHIEYWIENGEFERMLPHVLKEMVVHGHLHNLEIIFACGAGVVEESWMKFWSVCQKLRLVNGVLRNVLVKIDREQESK